MTSSENWIVPESSQPKPGEYAFDLERALTGIVGLRAAVPEDAFTAHTLGTERMGNGVLIRENGLILTVGYLIMEAQEVWLHLHNGRMVPGHVLCFDQQTGFGLVQALERLDLPVLPLGNSADAQIGSRVVVAGAGGRSHSLAAHIVARQEFAGYWEYVLDEALFTAPSHPHWGGTGMIGPQGELLGIGSLQLEGAGASGKVPLNMIIPIDLLKPILNDLLNFGQANRPPRPWLGIYASNYEERIIIMGLAQGGPADKAELRPGDVVLEVGGHEVSELAEFFRSIWALGDAGVSVPMKVWREGDTFDMAINSADRNSFLKAPQVH